MMANEVSVMTMDNDPSTQALAQMMNPVIEMLRGIAESQRLLNERVEKMEKQNALAMRVTAAQAKALNEALRKRAVELADEYELAAALKTVEMVARAIRRDVRLLNGVNSMREIPRCEYSVVLDQIGMWEDYDAIQAAIKKAKATP